MGQRGQKKSKKVNEKKTWNATEEQWDRGGGRGRWKERTGEREREPVGREKQRNSVDEWRGLRLCWGWERRLEHGGIALGYWQSYDFFFYSSFPHPCLPWDSLHSLSLSVYILLVHLLPLIKCASLHSSVCMICVVGRLTREKASQEQVESFMSQEREKRRTLLLKFLHTCSASKVPFLPFSLFWCCLDA